MAVAIGASSGERQRATMGRGLSLVLGWLVPLACLAELTLFLLARAGTLHASLPPFDETAYYQLAVKAIHGALPPADNSPTYVALYMLIIQVVHSANKAYEVMHTTIALLVVGLSFAAVRRWINPLLAMVCTIPVAANWELLRLDQYMVHVACAIPLALAILLIGNTPRRAGIVLCVFLAGLSIRQEYAGVILVATVALFPILRRHLQWYLPAACLLLLWIGYALVSPSWDAPGGRLWASFGPHYAWTQLEIDPARVTPLERSNHWIYYPTVVARDFGNAQSLPQAIRANPAAFLQHVVHNVAITPREMETLLGLATSLDPNTPTLEGISGVPLFILGCILVVLAAIYLVRYPARRVMMRPVLPLIGVAIGSGGFFISWWVIRPRPDYQFALMPLMAAGAALCLAVIWPSMTRRSSMVMDEARVVSPAPG